MLVVLTFGTLLVIYLVTCSSLFLATRLIFPEHSLQKSDWLFGLFGFLLVPASWGFWWTYAGRGVYGWLNMMHVTFWAGIIGGSFVGLRIWLLGRVPFPRLISFLCIAFGTFVVSFLLWRVFDL
jgi:hypothetical protein